MAKDVVRVACPETTVAVPRLAEPSLKVTVPVGLLPVTVAVSATVWLTAAGLTLAESETLLLVAHAEPVQEVPLGHTVMTTGIEVLVAPALSVTTAVRL